MEPGLIIKMEVMIISNENGIGKSDLIRLQFNRLIGLNWKISTCLTPLV